MTCSGNRFNLNKSGTYFCIPFKCNVLCMYYDVLIFEYNTVYTVFTKVVIGANGPSLGILEPNYPVR